MRAFVKDLINKMGDEGAFSDRDFEECYNKMGYNEHSNLHSQADISWFIKKVLDYREPNI